MHVVLSFRSSQIGPLVTKTHIQKMQKAPFHAVLCWLQTNSLNIKPFFYQSPSSIHLYKDFPYNRVYENMYCSISNAYLNFIFSSKEQIKTTHVRFDNV